MRSGESLGLHFLIFIHREKTRQINYCKSLCKYLFVYFTLIK